MVIHLSSYKTRYGPATFIWSLDIFIQMEDSIHARLERNLAELAYDTSHDIERRFVPIEAGLEVIGHCFQRTVAIAVGYQS